MKMTSRFALVAAAGMLMAVAPAKAADLGGGCCADLEERVAELEATTARKGNRVVSLQVYGYVDKALLLFDDDFIDDAYVVSKGDSQLGFTGNASIKPGVTAGFRLEFEMEDAGQGEVNQLSDESVNEILKIRKNEVWVEGETLGRLTIGHGSVATDGITEIILGSQIFGPGDEYSNFFVVDANGDYDNGLNGQWTGSFDGGREDRIRYDSPSIYGFILSASWGDDDFYDIALRFQKEWNSIRVAAGIGYREVDGINNTFAGELVDEESLMGSASIMHVPTGLYVAFAAGESSSDQNDFGDKDYWYASAGIEKRFLSYGSTTLYGEYGEYNNFFQVDGGDGLCDETNEFCGDTTMWGIGLKQKFDSAAMELYALYRHYDYDNNSTDINDGNDVGELSTFIVGTKISF